MKMTLLTAGAVAMTFAAAGALAAPAPSSPKQPIPYSQLDAYLKASPKARASKDWWSGQAAAAETGASANTSATVAAPASPPADATAAAPALPANPPIDNPPATTVNPPSSAAPASPEQTTPPK